MTLVAQLVHAGHSQQAGVLRAMRSVARQASFRLDRRMFIHKGPTILHVALGAYRIQIGGRPDVVVPERSVDIVAVAALQQAFVHLVMEGHVEGRLHVGVALITEIGLRCLQ